MPLKLGDEVRQAVVAGLVRHLRDRHARIGKQLAGVFYTYLGKALEDALVRALFEVAAQRRRVLLDVPGNVLQGNVFLEVVVQVGIDLIDGFLHVEHEIGTVICRIGQQFGTAATA